jgi:hypothetical protein
MINRNSKTLFAGIIKSPVPGTVFVHGAKRDRPYIVTSVEGDEISRVDLEGTVAPWGTIEDWRDEIRREMITIVYTP